MIHAFYRLNRLAYAGGPPSHRGGSMASRLLE